MVNFHPFRNILEIINLKRIEDIRNLYRLSFRDYINVIFDELGHNLEYNDYLNLIFYLKYLDKYTELSENEQFYKQGIIAQTSNTDILPYYRRTYGAR